MSSSAPPAGDTFDRLLSEMPAIAEAVNKFESAENQRAAFDAFMRAFGLDTPEGVPIAPAELTVVRSGPEASADDNHTADAASEPEGKMQASAARQRARKSGVKKSWPLDRQINFRPAGKQSLRDFAEEKQPTNNDHRNVLIVYYMDEILGMSTANISQVLAGYAACQWRPPGSPDVALRYTASKHGWIDTKDTKAIKITHAGRACVEYDLPAKNATKPA